MDPRTRDQLKQVRDASSRVEAMLLAIWVACGFVGIFGFVTVFSGSVALGVIFGGLAALGAYSLYSSWFSHIYNLAMKTMRDTTFPQLIMDDSTFGELLTSINSMILVKRSVPDNFGSQVRFAAFFWNHFVERLSSTELLTTAEPPSIMKWVMYGNRNEIWLLQFPRRRAICDFFLDEAGSA